MSGDLLTIGVPSYSRATECARLVNQILSEFARQVRVIVIDDSESGFIYDALMGSLKDRTAVTLLNNGKNCGYAGTLVRMFEVCDTPYLMMMADDDLVHPAGLSETLKFLADELPDFVAPQFLADNNIYRGKEHTCPVKPKEFLACSRHAPGLIYAVQSMGNALDRFKQRMSNSSTVAHVYPQVLLVASLIAEGRACYWLNVPTAVQGAALSSDLVDTNGSRYWSFESRWRQLTGFDDYLNSLLPTSTRRDAVVEMISANASQAFPMLIESMRSESPALSAAFDRQARKSYLKQWVKLILRPFVPS